jgi:hypothetical protein
MVQILRRGFTGVDLVFYPSKPAIIKAEESQDTGSSGIRKTRFDVATLGVGDMWNTNRPDGNPVLASRKTSPVPRSQEPDAGTRISNRVQCTSMLMMPPM